MVGPNVSINFGDCDGRALTHGISGARRNGSLCCVQARWNSEAPTLISGKLSVKTYGCVGFLVGGSCGSFGTREPRPTVTTSTATTVKAGFISYLGGFMVELWSNCHEGKITISCCVVNCTTRVGNGIRMINIPTAMDNVSETIQKNLC